MNFWQTFRSVTPNLTRGWQYLRQVAVRQKGRYYFVIPAFSVTAPTWIGSSYITTEFRLSGITQSFSLQPKNLTPPEDVNFCLAIRTPITNSDGEDVIRYKLWEDVGERLFYPLYDGELLSPDSVFEIWTSADFDETSLDVDYLIYTSLLVSSTADAQCAQAPSNSQANNLTQYCELFVPPLIPSGDYALPLVPSACFDDIQPSDETFFIIDQNDNILADESDNQLVHT